jgi:hypothetical protein
VLAGSAPAVPTETCPGGSSRRGRGRALRRGRPSSIGCDWFVESGLSVVSGLVLLVRFDVERDAEYREFLVAGGVVVGEFGGDVLVGAFGDDVGVLVDVELVLCFGVAAGAVDGE